MHAIFLVIFFSLFYTGFYHWALPYISYFHDQCLSLVPSTPHRDLQNAFICGHNKIKPSHFQLFRDLGLLHIIVVSGSHLIFLSNLLKKVIPKTKISFSILNSILIIYSFCCLLEPPVVRALLQLQIYYIDNKWRFNWSRGKQILLSGLWSLCLFPEWLHSYSLILSWLASLAISLNKKLRWQSLSCYFILIPVLAQWTFTHPITILVNWLFTPILSFVFFPATLVNLVLPFFAPGTTWLYSSLIDILHFIHQWIPVVVKKNGPPGSISFLWLYLWFVQFATIKLMLRSRETPFLSLLPLVRKSRDHHKH